MAATEVTTGSTGARTRNSGRVSHTARRLATETKSFFKTSEFAAFVLMTIAILIAGNTVEGKDGGSDYFAADKVWLYITVLTVGYMLSRGIAKSGVRDPYWDERGDRNADH